MIRPFTRSRHLILPLALSFAVTLNRASADPNEPPITVDDPGVAVAPAAPAEPSDDVAEVPDESDEPEPASKPGGKVTTKAPAASTVASSGVAPAVPAALPQETPAALPSGADKSGVTSKSISIPKGAGTIAGMEESFSAQLSTGIATFSVPLSLPAARGGAQPSLGLSYSSGGGLGVAGMGWSIGVPFIARQTDRGVPRYYDQTSWHPESGPLRVQRRAGARAHLHGECAWEAAPVRRAARSCRCGRGSWQYFRPRVEGSFLRFFWSPNHLTWRVQDKSGVTMELGVTARRLELRQRARAQSHCAERDLPLVSGSAVRHVGQCEPSRRRSSNP